MIFNEATQNNYKISYDEFYTERRRRSDMIVQKDTGSAQQVSGPLYLICAHQTQNRINVPDKNSKIAVIDYLDLRKYYVEIDGQRYPRDSLLIKYEQNDYIEQNKKTKFF